MNIVRAITAGLIATAVMSVVAIMAPLMGMPQMDFGEMLGTHNPIMELPYIFGWSMHFMVGIILAIVYAAIFVKQVGGSSVFKGILFAMIPFVIAQSMMMPMMGNGFWSSGDVMAIMGSFIGHIVFGAVLGFIYKENQ